MISTAVGSGTLRAERYRREARREIFTTPELVTARRSILGPPAEGRLGARMYKMQKQLGPALATGRRLLKSQHLKDRSGLSLCPLVSNVLVGVSRVAKGKTTLFWLRRNKNNATKDRGILCYKIICTKMKYTDY